MAEHLRSDADLLSGTPSEVAPPLPPPEGSRMSKFNTGKVRSAVSSPIKTEAVASGRTFEGAPGHARDTKSELFLLAVTNMVSEATFYEGASDRDQRFRDLVVAAASEDPEWVSNFLPWLRSEANMRSAPIVAAAELVRAKPEGLRTRAVVDAVLQRADEPAEILAYWLSRYGRPIPIALKRGIADAVFRVYTERSLLKYDGKESPLRFGDVIELAQPRYHKKIYGTWRDDLYGYAIDRRHRSDAEIPGGLRILFANAVLRQRAAQDPTALLDAEALQAAGVTWENALSLAGDKVDKKALWEALIPSMGYMALLRNLRNFDQAGVSDEIAERVAARLADPEQVAKSRQFPFRFLAAYNAAPSLRWGWALEKALNASLANVPPLPGRTLILVDRSGSMFGPVSQRSGLNRADSAAIFGTALALRAASADLVEFGTGHRRIRPHAGASVLAALKEFTSMGGTNTAEAVRANYRGHDRVVIVTDEQAWGGYYGADPTGQVPANVPVYTWNLAGYEYGHGPSGNGQRHTFGGLTDAAFRMIPLLEAGRDAAWPF